MNRLYYILHSRFSIQFQNNFLPVTRLYDWKRCHRPGRNTNIAFTGEWCDRDWIAIDCNRHRRHKTMCVSVWRRPIQIAGASEISGHIFLTFLSFDKCRIVAVNHNHTIAARKSLFRRTELLFAGIWCAWNFDGCVYW